MNEMSVANTANAPSPSLPAIPESHVHTRPGSDYAEPSMPARRHDNQRSTIAGRHGDDFVFAPRESTFYFEHKVTLSSRPIQIAYDHTFQRCQLALFETELIAPIIARDDDGVRAVNAALDTKIRRFEDYMEGERNRINKILADNGKPLDRGDFTAPESVSVRIFTPRSRRYLDMLQLADDMITTYARAWLEGFMDEVSFKRSVFSVRMRTINLAREIWELHTRSFFALRKARQRADEERGRLREAREASRRARLHAKAHPENQPAIGAEESADESTHDEQLAALDATVAKADGIIEDIDRRGGMEEHVPDFGTAELASESPALMAAENKSAARRRKTEHTDDEKVAAE